MSAVSMAAHPSIIRWRFDARLARRCGIAGCRRVSSYQRWRAGKSPQTWSGSTATPFMGYQLAEACSELLRTSGRVFGPWLNNRAREMFIRIVELHQTEWYKEQTLSGPDWKKGWVEGRVSDKIKSIPSFVNCGPLLHAMDTLMELGRAHRWIHY